MKKIELDRIESALSIKLIPAYRTLMKEYPFHNTIAFSDDARSTLLNNPDKIITLNQDFRVKGWGSKKKKWLPNYFLIGKLNWLNFFMDISNESEYVYQIGKGGKYEPGKIELLLHSHSLDEFISGIKTLERIAKL